MKRIIALVNLVFISFSVLTAQVDKADESAAQANNPLANFTAFNIQNYYTSKLTNSPASAYMNTGWLRYAKPFSNGKFLLRVSAPISTIGSPDSAGIVQSVSGLGDANAFVSYSFISKPNATVGIGPLLVAPTASQEELGSGKWQAGFAFVAFIVHSPVFQFGGLVTWQASFAGDKDRSNTNLIAVQPFYFWQLGKGTYLRGAPIWAFNIENKAYSIPIGLGIGKVVKVGKTIYNMFIEPQYTMLSSGTQPQFQLFMGINLQFKK